MRVKTNTSAWTVITNIRAARLLSLSYVPNLLNLRRELFISDQRTLLKYLDFPEKEEILKTIEKSFRKHVRSDKKVRKAYYSHKRSG